MANAVYELAAKGMARAGQLASVVTFGYGIAVFQTADDSGQAQARGPKTRIAQLATRHQLAPREIGRLYRVMSEWPEDLVDQGLTEELGDILAARELANMKPLTMEDVALIREAIATRNESE